MMLRCIAALVTLLVAPCEEAYSQQLLGQDSAPSTKVTGYYSFQQKKVAIYAPTSPAFEEYRIQVSCADRNLRGVSPQMCASVLASDGVFISEVFLPGRRTGAAHREIVWKLLGDGDVHIVRPEPGTLQHETPPSVSIYYASRTPVEFSVYGVRPIGGGRGGLDCSVPRDAGFTRKHCPGDFEIAEARREVRGSARLVFPTFDSPGYRAMVTCADGPNGQEIVFDSFRCEGDRQRILDREVRLASGQCFAINVAQLSCQGRRLLVAARTDPGAALTASDLSIFGRP